MKLISLFAGVGGFDLGFERSGFTVVGQCEIDPHAQAVLKRHWPDVPLHGDITTLEGDAFGPAEVVVWGSPCQGLSLAGRRAGLKDERSGLFTEGIRFIRELREVTNGEYPRFSVWENVPGALSSNGGHDFRAVLEAFIEAEVPMPRSGKWANAGVVRGNDREVAWRVLDSQHFGVAQRRRRVFVVADFGGHGAAEILFEREGVPGHPPQGRAPAKGITGALTGGASSSSAGNIDDNRAQAGFVVPVITNPVTYAVRRLTPRECERLQGLPDDWTELGHYYEGFDRERLWNAKTRTRPKGEEAEAIVRKIADTQRYRLVGNAVTVNVAEWLGGRVAAALTAEELEDAA